MDIAIMAILLMTNLMAGLLALNSHDKTTNAMLGLLIAVTAVMIIILNPYNTLIVMMMTINMCCGLFGFFSNI